MSNQIVKMIGLPAVLEQCAEECTELAHACLKMARKLRDENPTPKELDEIKNDIKEELVDVELLSSILCGELIFRTCELENMYEIKYLRWLDRLHEHKKQED